MRKLLPALFHSSAPLKILELVLVLFVFFVLGAWQMYMGWQNPDHVGWTTSGTILMTGMIGCTFLIWRRRKTNYSGTSAILFFMQLANAAEGFLKWQAHQKGATWPTVNCALAVVFLVLIFWQEKNRRKEADRDAACEFKIFEMEDRL